MKDMDDTPIATPTLDHNTPNRVVFDIETKKTFDEVGGYQNTHELGVSYLGVYSYSQDKLFGFFEEDLDQLEAILIKEQPMLIGFNSISFDNTVLQPYFSKLDLSTLPHLDILKEVEVALGHRLKLDSVAEGTLHTKKSGDGLDAIRWFREGDYDSLVKYCLDDVAITRDVYEYGRRHGKLWYPTGGDRKGFPINWGYPETIQDRVLDAFKRHVQISVEYFDVQDDRPVEKRRFTLEVLDVEGDKFEAYCHESGEKGNYRIANIWDIDTTDETFAHQGALF